MQKGSLNNLEIWMPLDSTYEYSRVISLSFSNQISFKSTTQTRHKINEITNHLIESVVVKDQKDANVMINQLMITMINRHLIKIQGDLTSEKLLLPSRIGLCFDKFVNNPKEIDITNIEVTIEPFDLKVGFRELDNFKQLQELVNGFVQRISRVSCIFDFVF